MPEDWDEPTISAALMDFHNPTHARVLDIGCGDGKRTTSYIERADSVIGIDPNRTLLETYFTQLPPSLHSRIGLVQARAETLPFPPDAFDMALLSWSL